MAGFAACGTSVSNQMPISSVFARTPAPRRSILMACRCLVQSSTRERNRPAGLKNRNTKSSENAKMSL